jgi:hypothetical protein
MTTTKPIKKKNYILSFLLSMFAFLNLLYLGKRERFLILIIIFIGIAFTPSIPVSILTYMLIGNILASIPLTMAINEWRL